MERDSIQKEDLLAALNGNIVSTSDRTKSRSLLKFLLKVSQLPLKYRILFKEIIEIMSFEKLIGMIKMIVELETTFRVGRHRFTPEGRQIYNKMKDTIKVYTSIFKDLDSITPKPLI